MSHRDDPRRIYKDKLERLEAVTGENEPSQSDMRPRNLRGDVSEADAEAIRELLDALDPEVPGKVAVFECTTGM